jgi:hypothetical protein
MDLHRHLSKTEVLNIFSTKKRSKNQLTWCSVKDVFRGCPKRKFWAASYYNYSAKGTKILIVCSFWPASGPKTAKK